MIRLLEMLLRRRRETPVIDMAKLDRRLDEAKAQGEEAKMSRRRAERLGPDFRAELSKNHFGDRIMYALEPRGWKPR